MSDRAGSALHPGAWWLFGFGLLIGSSQIANPLLNLSMIAALSFVVALRRPLLRFGNPFVTALKVGGVLIVVRIVIAVVFGDRSSGTVLLSLPRLAVPAWMAGVSVGGPITIPLLVNAFCLGLGLATVLAIFGACSALAPPERLLQSLPRAMYEVGLSLAIALAFLPELVASAQALKAARRLRGRPTTGLAGLRGTFVPILEGALERSITLAASMDARGFGRTARDGHRTAGLVISVVSLTALIVGGTGLLGGWTPTWLWTGFLVVGVGGLVVALHLRAAVVLRTSFDTQPFTVRSVVVSALGVAVSVGLLVAGNLCPRLLDAPAPETMPTVSTLSLLAVLGIVAAGILAPKATS